jgi:hypothetical protein
MADAGQKRRFAIDTNILFDLGGRKPFAEDFIEFFKEKGFGIYVPPTVIAELGLLADDPSKLKIAESALLSIPKFGLLPFEMRSVGEDITANFYRLLTSRGLLPFEEKNDAEILTETSLHNLPILATRDAHLLGIDEDDLALVFNEADLDIVKIVHPRDWLMAGHRVYGI